MVLDIIVEDPSAESLVDFLQQQKAAL